jgi:hypothetical protein
VREPHTHAQRVAVSGQESDAISQEEPDSVSGREPDSVAVAGCDSLSRYQPKPVTVSELEPDSVANQIAVAASRRRRVRIYPASCQSRRSPLGSTMSATGMATSQLGPPSALTRISMTSDSLRWATPAQSLRNANTTGRTRFKT